ncbi:MAG TPA: Os1348 family NHLP clan protein [Chloroflexota bacterium]|jgi:hypothetical protein
MSKRGVEQVLMRALGDGDFRKHLQDQPDTALTGFDLTDEERAAILGGDKNALLDFGIDKRLIQMMPPSIYKA